MIKRSWTEINLDTIASNYRIYEQQILKDYEKAGITDCQIMAVVKADAYGHGDVQVARRLVSEGCRNFAVSNIEEAVRIRCAGVTGQILILGYTPLADAGLLAEHDITQALLSRDYASRLARVARGIGVRIKAQYAIDTGMNRIGLDADDIGALEEAVREAADEFELTGIFTHLCVADTPAQDEFTATQLEKFRKAAERLSDLKLPFIHCMNSAGGLWQEPYGNLARLGIILYGLKPDYDNELPDGIKPALTWKSVISLIKDVHPGESVGYGRSFIAGREMRVATIPTGYADGYSRDLSNKGCVIIRGKKAPIIGRICMDQMMADVTDIPEARFEDEVLLLCEQYGADDMAADAGTIGYEIICDIGKRTTRTYI